MRIRSGIRNQRFILKLMLPLAWKRLLSGILISILSGIATFLKDVLLIKLLVNGLTQNLEPKALIIYIIYIFIFDFIVDLLFRYYNLYLIKTNKKLSELFIQSVIKKADSVDLMLFESKDFFNSYSKTLDKGDGIFIKYLQTINSLVSSFVIIIGIIIYAIQVNYIIIIVSIITCALSYIIKNRKSKNEYSMFNDLTPINRKLSYVDRVFYLNEYGQEFKLFSLYRYLYKKYNEYFNIKISKQKKYYKKSAFYDFVSASLPYIGTYFVISLVSVWKIVQGFLSVGDYISLNNASFQLIFRIDLVISRLNDLYEHNLYIQNFKNFMEYETSITDGDKDIDTNVKDFELKHVNFSYDDGTPALKNINMKIKNSEKIAIVGLNGAGKTTLVKILMRLYDPDSGNVIYNGNDIKDYIVKEYQGLFSTVFQDYKQYAFSVKENLYFDKADNIPDDAANDILDAVNLLQKVQSHQDGMQAEIGNEFSDGINFSGGEGQKLAIARAMARKSPVMIFDEASSALDPISEYKINKMLLQSFEQKTMIIISHRLSTVLNADRIYYFHNGEIIEQGTHEELLLLKGKYYTLFKTQASQYTL